MLPFIYRKGNRMAHILMTGFLAHAFLLLGGIGGATMVVLSAVG
jgi:hypothetical protein